jgi:flagellar basal body-associated protein FliL
MDNNQGNPYDFILSSGQQPKKNIIPTSINPNSKKSRVIIFVAGGIILLIVLIVGWSIISNLGKENNEDLLSIGVTQANILSLTDDIKKNGRSSDLKKFVVTAELNLVTDSNELNAHLKKKGVKIPTKVFKPTNQKDIEKLEEAQQNNNYDSTSKKLLTTALTEYSKQLGLAFDDTGSKSEKQLLETMFSGVKILLDED